MPEHFDKLSAPSKRTLKVFLCHAHSDKNAVRALYTRLTGDGVDAWFDKEKLLPGQDWELEIRKAVCESDVVVVCLSKQFNQAGFRQREVRLALDTAMEQPEGEIFIIPARLEECKNLESLRKWHWVDLFDEGGYEKMMKSLKLRATQLENTNVKTPHGITTKLNDQFGQDPDNHVNEQKTAWAAPTVHNFDFSGANLDSVIVNPIDPFELSKQLREQAIPKETRSTVVPENENENEIHQITLEERRKGLLKQEEKAIQYEHSGNKREALKIYEDLKRSDILSDIKDIDIDTKILALKLELNSTNKSTQEKKPLAQ